MKLPYLVFSAALFLGSCSQFSAAFLVLQGNYQFQRGAFQQAAIKYLQALPKGYHAEYIYYDLGNVYSAFGEYEAALQAWEKAGIGSTLELRFNIHFNRGLLYYQLGEYKAAFEQYRTALQIKPGQKEAVINLELALTKWQASQTAGSSPAIQAEAMHDKPPQEDLAEQAQDQRILNYLKAKEGRYWTNTRNRPKSSTEDW